jgi:hypothetical protein
MSFGTIGRSFSLGSADDGVGILILPLPSRKFLVSWRMPARPAYVPERARRFPAILGGGREGGYRLNITDEGTCIAVQHKGQVNRTAGSSEDFDRASS